MISDSATYVSYDKDSERYIIHYIIMQWPQDSLLKKPQKGETLI